MEKKQKRINNEGILHIITTFTVILIAVVGLYAMLYGSKYEDVLESVNSHYSFNICPNCDTRVPCLQNHNGRTFCPSCGVIMNRKGRGLFSPGTTAGTDISVVGNFGFGLGPLGNLVCPDCGLVTQHQRGLPCYTVNCHRCGATMVRQFPANIQTAFATSGKNQNNQTTIPAPPITTDAVMKHEYRGVCSSCHNIVKRTDNINAGNIIGAAYRIGPGGCVIR